MRRWVGSLLAVIVAACATSAAPTSPNARAATEAPSWPSLRAFPANTEFLSYLDAVAQAQRQATLRQRDGAKQNEPEPCDPSVEDCPEPMRKTRSSVTATRSRKPERRRGEPLLQAPHHHQCADRRRRRGRHRQDDRALPDRAAGRAAVLGRHRRQRRPARACRPRRRLSQRRRRHLVRRNPRAREPHRRHRLQLRRERHRVFGVLAERTRALHARGGVFPVVERLLRHRELRDAAGRRQSRHLHAAVRLR